LQPGAWTERRRAQERSGYPRGARHEVQSVAMLEAHADLLRVHAHDLDLVLYLVGSHHGFCRPFAPAVHDASPADVVLNDHRSGSFGTISLGPTGSNHGLERLDSAVADRFWNLVERYGWHELCWMEAVMRLADHRASEQELDWLP
jgi:CRISPR-associated endonuclease/helicase Cas3